MRPHAYALLPSAPANKRKRGTAAALTWPVCKRCGLVLLRNDATERAARKPCVGLEDDE